MADWKTLALAGVKLSYVNLFLNKTAHIKKLIKTKILMKYLIALGIFNCLSMN